MLHFVENSYIDFMTSVSVEIAANPAADVTEYAKMSAEMTALMAAWQIEELYGAVYGYGGRGPIAKPECVLFLKPIGRYYKAPGNIISEMLAAISTYDGIEVLDYRKFGNKLIVVRAATN